jgi:hypothetical protein
MLVCIVRFRPRQGMVGTGSSPVHFAGIAPP